ncbi:putative diacetyl reductase [(R)-acetoin forming] 2 [Pseudocercospora fuligena]|uniref:Putative diacetyl reductase [(R)-acetoin forming] 2 n=1 Tax=Pseudocercospora fuligena TaxID=685502 RepID=A0A8H6VIH7_9PEZI|nr:putative diacetyl reductase [(R)-acetoin forming] 2 [Pseudocercospora fuligena]
MSKMNAVRFHAAKDIRVDQVEIPVVKPGWVRLKPAFSGICGSDLHEYLDGPHIIPPQGQPHVMTGESPPVILGHEFSGVIDQIGDDVVGLKVGDKVAVQPTIYDGGCRACRRGLTNCCDAFGFIGLSGWGGGMSEFTTAPAEYCKKLPDDMPLEIGALVEPLAVGWHAVATSPYEPGDSVLVLGGGPIGLSVVLALRAQGCQNIIVSEVSQRRREFAKTFGAHHAIDPTSDDVPQKVKDLTEGEGVDVCFDAAGVQIGVDSGLKAVTARGTFVNIALWGDRRPSLDMIDMLFGERKYMAVVTYIAGDFEAVIDAIHTGKLKPEGMITKVIGPHEVAEEGFKALTDDKDNQVKILVDMSKLTEVKASA